ncbi:hypothetical protein NA8A_23494 [Nitratireductor indicus C115]|uniref:Uncharacterized protein n=1 Tax=Nitratireductor indicus C115 TaxID=1231190 RepID=K2NPX1_9HYPH|nr:hypothetical protein [Nitratireductor indicus]EKF39909.1 hypothetical protein NA8A_23494 [Nitratireductor indicus C115]SFQ81853.1 hypothetical protein SAMN05216176_1256 [Nitratireductor indicus]
MNGRAKVIAINNSWQLVPWADILYACDFAWWERYRGVPEFEGLKLSVDASACRRPWGIQKVGLNKHDDGLELMKLGTVGWAGNSGFHCLNLAVQMWPAKIILVGFDMRVDLGLHWHGPHKGLNNPSQRNVERWRRCMDAVAGAIREFGIEVINASPTSALKNYPKMGLMEAMEC